MAFEGLEMIELMIFAFMAFSDVSEQPACPEVWKVTRHEGWDGRVPFVKDPMLLRLVEDPNFTPDWVEEAKADEKGSEGTGLKPISAVYAELLLALRG